MTTNIFESFVLEAITTFLAVIHAISKFKFSVNRANHMEDKSYKLFGQIGCYHHAFLTPIPLNST